MTDCLVVGMPNVGKTSFLINFAEYMGLKELKLYVKQSAGYTTVRSYDIVEARNELISTENNYTREIQSIKLEFSVGKINKELEIFDSTGLSDGIHSNEKIREAMASTIIQLKKSKLILHIIDLSNINYLNKDLLNPIDKMIMDFSSIDKHYAILANKIDLNRVNKNLRLLKEMFSSYYIFPISALYMDGFKDVKRFVLNYV